MIEKRVSIWHDEKGRAFPVVDKYNSFPQDKDQRIAMGVWVAVLIVAGVLI